MKGIAPLVLLAVIAIGGLTLWGLYLHYGIGESSSYKRFFRDLKLVNLENSIYLIRETLSQSLLYSFYQAFFEVFSNGGFESPQNNIPFWRDYNKVNVPSIDENIKSKTLEYYNQYKEEINNKIKKFLETQISSSDSVSFILNKNLLIIKALSNNGISVHGDTQIEIPDIVVGIKRFSSNFYSDILSFTTYLSEEISEKDKLKEIFQRAEDSAKNSDSSCGKLIIIRCENQESEKSVPQKCREIFVTKYHEYLKEWNDSLKNLAPSTLKFSLEIKEERSQTELNLISIEDLGEDVECGCEEYGYNETTNTTFCMKYYNKIKEVYDIKYLGYAKLLFDVSKDSSVPLEDALPVFDFKNGRNIKEFPSLVFYVRSGTLTS